MALLYGCAGRLTATNGGFGPGQMIGRRAPVRMQPVNQDMGAGQPPRLVGLEICTGQLESFRQQFWPHVQPVIAALDQAGDAEHAAWLRRSTALLDPAVALPNRAPTTEEKTNCYTAVRVAPGHSSRPRRLSTFLRLQKICVSHRFLTETQIFSSPSQICALWRV